MDLLLPLAVVVVVLLAGGSMIQHRRAKKKTAHLSPGHSIIAANLRASRRR